MKKLDIFVVILSGALFIGTPDIFKSGDWKFWGYWAAQISQFAFLISLLPGIYRRLEMFKRGKSLYVFLRKYRRTVGIVAYITGVLHFYWSYILPNPGQFFPSLISDWMGFVGLFLLTPLFLTSNDFSLNHLGLFWKKLHLLVHLAIWLLLMHVVIKGRFLTSLITGGVLIIDIISWILVALRDSVKSTK
ncbi:MAG: hypothetical protein AAB512_03370 [Patescibacteria group bacterium]